MKEHVRIEKTKENRMKKTPAHYEIRVYLVSVSHCTCFDVYGLDLASSQYIAV